MDAKPLTIVTLNRMLQCVEMFAGNPNSEYAKNYFKSMFYDIESIRSLIAAAERSCKRPIATAPTDWTSWEVDHKETDSGSGRYDYYFIMNSDGKVVCDSSNSDVQEIQTEHDETGGYAWDEQGKKDLTRLVQCRNALAGVPDPAAFMSAVDALLSLPNFDNRISMWTAEIEAFQLLRATRGKRP